MVISVQPIKIKDSMYILIPKRIADMAEINYKSKGSLYVKQSGNKNILEYSF